LGTEGGNVWLTADKTSVYKFYQFWLNTTDVDADIKILPLDKETTIIFRIEVELKVRVLQRKLAEELTIFVHSKEGLEKRLKL
jgi:tyrosyl-tRNA synthetase